MRVLYKLFMAFAGSLCVLVMLVVGELGVAGVLAACVLFVLLDVPERIGVLVGGDGRG